MSPSVADVAQSALSLLGGTPGGQIYPPVPSFPPPAGVGSGPPPDTGNIESATYEFLTVVGRATGTQQLGVKAQSIAVFNASQKQIYLSPNTEIMSVFQNPLYIVPPYSFMVVQIATEVIVWGVQDTSLNPVAGEIFNIEATTRLLPPALYKLPDGLGLSPATSQLSMGSGIAPANASHTFSLPITPDINGVLLSLENSSNVSSLSAVGHQTGTPYFSQAAPYGGLIAFPIDSVHDSSIDLTFTMPVNQTCQWYASGRRDSLLSAITQLNQVPATVTIAGGSVGVSGTVVTKPLGIAGSTASCSLIATTPGQSFTFGPVTIPSRLTRIAISATAAGFYNPASHNVLTFDGVVEAQGATTGKIEQLYESLLAAVSNATTGDITPTGETVSLDLEMDMATVFPGDSAVKIVLISNVDGNQGNLTFNHGLAATLFYT